MLFNKIRREEVLIAVFGGFAVFAALTAGATWWDRQQEERWLQTDVPVTIFRSQVTVPNFVEGENPLVVYDTVTLMDFIGDFRVEVRNRQNQVVCHGSEEGIPYTRDKKRDPSKTTFDWYIGKTVGGIPCSEQIRPGEYYLLTIYQIRVLGKPQLEWVAPAGNWFTILPKESKPTR